MFSSMASTLSVALVLAVVALIAAALAEGRGRHLLRLILGARSRETLDDVLAEVPRDEADWELVEAVNSQPDRPAPGERVAAWAAEVASKATDSVSERAGAIAKPHDKHEAPRSGELGLAHR